MNTEFSDNNKKESFNNTSFRKLKINSICSSNIDDLTEKFNGLNIMASSTNGELFKSNDN